MRAEQPALEQGDDAVHPGKSLDESGASRGRAFDDARPVHEKNFSQSGVCACNIMPILGGQNGNPGLGYPPCPLKRAVDMRGALYMVLVLLSFAPEAPAAAQSESGSAAIEGVVTDPSDSRVVGAIVIIRNEDTGYARTLVTDGAGEFAARVMPVGNYAVEVSAPGFAVSRYRDLRLTVGETKTLTLGLQLAPVFAKVTVLAEPLILDKEEVATGTSVLLRSVSDLPIRGRNFPEFVQLTPAVLQESDRNGLVISGQRSINANIAIDGADFNDPLQGNQRGGNEAVFFFPQTAVREFQVVRSGASAEIGRTNAAFVNVVTRSGTNVLHGELFYYNRNRRLTSLDAFSRSLNNKQNQFGGSAGGPLKRDRWFFFIAAEQNFSRVPFVVEFDPQPPGVIVPSQLLALQGELRGTNNPTALFSRADFMFRSRHSVNLQYLYTQFRGENFDFDSTRLNEAESTNYTRKAASHGLKGGLVSVLTRDLVNDLRVQVATDDRSEIPNLFAPLIVIRGFGRIGGDSGRPRLFDSTRYQLTDNVSWNRGSHALRLGFDFNLNRVKQQREANIQGRYDFRSLSDFLASRISRYRQTLPGFNPEELVFRGTQTEFAVYAQDKIALRHDLTLTVGLRWEGLWNPQPPRPNPRIPETGLIPNDLAQWQPRLGLAWRPDADGGTVLRLSGGLYDARTPATLFQRVFTDNGLTAVAVDSSFDRNLLTFVRFPDPLTSVPPGIKAPPPRVFGFDQNFRNPRSFQTSVTLERLLAEDLVVSAGYVHNSTWNLQQRLDRNLLPPTIDATGTPIFQTRRPDPNVGILSINQSSAHSTYDALTLTATGHSLLRRLHIQANYTLARNLDDDSNERNFSRETALNPFNLSIEKSYSKQDVRHNFNMSGVADLPNGFTLAAILIARSGFPYTPVIGFDIQNDANDDNDRALINGRVARRNSFRQPRFFNLDLRVVKSFQLGPSRLELVAEAFNVVRASNKNFGNDSVSEFGTPDRQLPTAGQPLFAPSTARFGGPRQGQLGLRLMF